MSFSLAIAYRLAQRGDVHKTRSRPAGRVGFRRALTLAFVLGASGPAWADAPEVETLTTPAGHEIHHVPLPDADYTQVLMFWPNQAALSVPGKEGLLALGTRLPLMEANGRDFDEAAEILNDVRQGLTFVNSLSGTALLFRSQDESFDPVVGIINDTLKAPALKDDDLEELATEITDNLAASERNPAVVAERAMGAFIGGADSRLPALTNRPLESVTAVMSADVRAFLDEALRGPPIIVASGPTNSEVIGEAVDAVLADLPTDEEADAAQPAPIPYEHAGQTLAVDVPEIEQAIITVPLVLPSYSPKAGTAINALGAGDGSRLFAQLREELGATYGVEARIVPLLADTQLVSFVAAVPPERAQEVIDIIRKEIETVRMDGVTDAELAASREGVLAGVAQRNADPAMVAGTLGDIAVMARQSGNELPTDALDQSAREMNALTLEEVNAALPDLLPERATVVVVTPQPDAIEADCTVETPEDAANCEG